MSGKVLRSGYSIDLRHASLRRVLALRFRAGGMLLFIPWRVPRAAPDHARAGGCPFRFGEFCLAASFCPDRLAAPAACGIGETGSTSPKDPLTDLLEHGGQRGQ
jgi:hypothetical protein